MEDFTRELTPGFGHLSPKLRKELVELLGAIKQPK